MFDFVIVVLGCVLTYLMTCSFYKVGFAKPKEEGDDPDES